ncbi:tetraacyldisaccharide 4'-kinase [Aurantibacillus circumpalustris]|uniref:tetraacyldisaccharide 4'-kinase n=1 Tax=Aurantibacillus circumpalustris TaxID=3036359 RepID=UPI00295B9DE1|nr:tetraacyldisaccharide 4'-kinase [Aurantibacillus circumpalustris]
MPIAFLYGIITFIRNSLYDWRILKEKKFDVHTIGVGNLAVGGAGKTPLVEYLIRLLKKEDPNIATLSRGYKRKSIGFVLADENSTAEDIGDEPLIYKLKYKVQVAVDVRRVSGIKKLIALKQTAPKIILLDDVFQHRSIRCGLNVVVSDYHNLYYNDFMLPAGTLREFKRGINRADIIIITKTPENTSPIDIRNIIKDVNPKAHQQVFFSYLKYGELYMPDNQNTKLDTLNELFRFRVISFAGIANAQPMVNYLKEYAAEVRHLPFPDHHEYTLKDLHDIERYYNSFEGGNKILVTTEKDLMRLKNPLVWEIAKTMNIYILPVEVTFKDKEEELNEIILKYVRTNRIHHKKYT